MELGDPGFISMIGFGIVVIVGGLIMAAVSFLSMKETSFEDVVAAEKRKRQEEEKERSRLNKEKRERFKKKFELKKKKDSKPGGSVNGKVSSDGVSPVHEVQIKPTPAVAVDEQKKTKAKAKAPPVAEVPAKKKEASPPKVEVVKPMIVTPPQAVAPPQPPRPTVQVVKPTKQSVPPRQAKVSFSEDVEEITDKIETEQKPKKKKTKKNEENPVVEALRNCELDGVLAKQAIDIFKQKLGSGEWLTSNPEFAELNKTIQSKDAELARCRKETTGYKSKLLELTAKVEEEKSKGDAVAAKLTKELDGTRLMCDSLNKQIQSLMQEKQSQTVQMQMVKSDNGDVKKLKEENDILKLTIQANANEVKEKQRLAAELQRVNDELKKSESTRSDLETKLNEYSGSIQQKQADLEQSYSKRIEEMSKELHVAHEHYSSLESDFQKAQSELQTTQNESAKLLDQVVMLSEANEQKGLQEAEYSSLVETKDALEKRLDEMDAKDAERAEEAAKLTTQNKELTAKNKELQEQSERLSAKLDQVTSELTNFKKDASSSQQQVVQQNTLLRERDTKLSKLETELDANKNLVVKYQEEVKKMKNKNNELRERNWKAMDAVSAAEKLAKDRCASAKEEQDVALNNLENKVKTALAASFPDVTCDSQNFDEWMQNFLKSASEGSVVVNNEPDDETIKRLESLEKTNSDLESTCGQLRSDAEALRRSLDGALQRGRAAEGDRESMETQLAAKDAELEKFKLAMSSTEQLLSDLQSAAEKEEAEREELKKKQEKERSSLLESERKTRSDAEKKLLENNKRLEEVSQQRDALETKLRETENDLEESRQKLSARAETPLPPPEQLRDEATRLSSPSRDPDPPGVAISEDAEHGFLIVEQQRTGESRDHALENGNAEDEIAKLKERLEKEKQLTKNLGAAANKLQTVLKQTQDQLNKERLKNQSLAEKTKDEDSSSSSSSSSELD